MEKVKKALTLDYTSSEEEGEGENRHCLITVSLSWESSKLRRYKDQLDKVHLENPTRHAIAQQKQIKMKTTMTSRAAPDKAPAYHIMWRMYTQTKKIRPIFMVCIFRSS